MAFIDLQAESVRAKPKGWLHREMISEIVKRQPGAKATGFWDAMRSLPDAEYLIELMKVDKEWTKSVRFTPDAFLIDEPERTVVVYEAVHTNDLDRYKFSKITELAWALDSTSWTLLLCRVDVWSAVFYCPLHIWLSETSEIVAGELAKQHRYRDWRSFHVDETNARLFPESAA